MLCVILLVLVLFFVQTLLPASIRYLFAGPGTGARLMMALGSRDSQPPLSTVGQRAERALANLYESLPIFIALALLLIVQDRETPLALQGAWLFVIARVLYVPAYLAGVFLLRSILWTGGVVGLVIMAVALLG